MTAKIKLNAASGGGSISIQAPSSSSNNRVIALPDIADGTLVTSQSTLDATKLSGNLPAISGAALTGISTGISMAQQWRQTTGVQPSSGTYTTLQNWEANDAPSGYGSIGSSMTESSGVFTFPSTGIYLLKYSLVIQSANGAKRLNMSIIEVTTDNSNYNQAAKARASMYGTDAFSSCFTEFIFDVTDVSTHKCRFQFWTVDTQCYTMASTDTWRTGVTFIRLGDT